MLIKSKLIRSWICLCEVEFAIILDLICGRCWAICYHVVCFLSFVIVNHESKLISMAVWESVRVSLKLSFIPFKKSSISMVNSKQDVLATVSIIQCKQDEVSVWKSAHVWVSGVHIWELFTPFVYSYSFHVPELNVEKVWVNSVFIIWSSIDSFFCGKHISKIREIHLNLEASRDIIALMIILCFW